MECSTEVWERVLFQSLELLPDSNDEPLAATVDFIFKAALHCQHLPEAVSTNKRIYNVSSASSFLVICLFPWGASLTLVCLLLQVRSVRVRLKNLGTEVSPCVLDYLSRTITSCADIAESIFRDIDCDEDFGDNFSPTPRGLFIFGESGPNSEKLLSGEDQAFHGSSYFSDIYILIEMLSIPCLAVEAAQIFERAVARGTFDPQSVAVALERRITRRLNFTSQYVAENFQQPDVVMDGEAIEQIRSQGDDFTSVLGLAETLALSRDSRVKGFVKILYAILFKQYPDESHRLRMLKRLVDRATTTADASRDIDLDMEILVMLACEQQETVRPVLSMMREVAELANVDRATLWHQLCASEDDILRIREERNAETASMSKEKVVLSQRINESEATNSRLKVIIFLY